MLERMYKEKHFSMAGRSADLYSHFENIYGGFSENWGKMQGESTGREMHWREMLMKSAASL